MNASVKPGDTLSCEYVVRQEDVASFQGVVVHPVCSTFALAREIEWTTRQFVLAMRDADEEGIGTFLNIEHRSPARVGERIVITATVETLQGHELICKYEAKTAGNVIATGKTGQKILKKDKIEQLLNR